MKKQTNEPEFMKMLSQPLFVTLHSFSSQELESLHKTFQAYLATPEGKKDKKIESLFSALEYWMIHNCD